MKKGGLVLKAEKNGEPVFVNGKQVGKTPFSGSVPLCAVVEVGKGRERVDVELGHNGRVEHTHKYEYEVLRERGNAYYDEGNYDQAIEDYTAALRIKPDYYRAQSNRGYMYYSKGDYDSAIEDYTVALRIKPDDVLSLYWRGNAYYYKGNYDRAIKDLETVLKIDQNYFNTRELLEEIRQIKAGANSYSYSNEPYKSNIKYLTDNRDGKKYKTVTIGRQIWMAENLNYNAKGSKCYNNNLAYCEKYGRLYNWATAMKACPTGWHLPSNREWDALYRYVDGTSGTSSPYKSETAGKYLKASSGWNNEYDDLGQGNGTDNYGFSALPGGLVGSKGYFEEVNDAGFWWSSSSGGNANTAYSQAIFYVFEYAVGAYEDKSHLYSVRCLKD